MSETPQLPKIEYGIYLAGPMTGLPESNFPAFHEAAKKLRTSGYKVFNPAETPHVDGWSHADYLRYDFPILLTCRMVVFLPGWKRSEGALAEFFVARKTGIPAHQYEPRDSEVGYYLPEIDAEPELSLKGPGRVETPKWVPNGVAAPAEETILEEAERLVGGDRNSAYGHPIDDFSKTAKMWTGTLLPKLKEGEEVSAEEVGLCMVQVKVSREINKHKRDNLVDAAGYIRCVDRIVAERARRAAA